MTLVSVAGLARRVAGRWPSVSRRAALMALVAFPEASPSHRAAAGKRKRKKRCKGGKVRCGHRCCPRGQGCVGGACGCPSAKCAQAVDPTNDQFEGCTCEPIVGSEDFCTGTIVCGGATPCATSGDCPPGWRCNLDGCGEGQSVCVPVCSLG